MRSRCRATLLTTAAAAIVLAGLSWTPSPAAAPGGSQADTAQIDVAQQAKKGSVTLPAEFTFRAESPRLSPRERSPSIGDTAARPRAERSSWVPSGTSWTSASGPQSVPLVSLAKNGFPPAFMKRMWFITFGRRAPESEEAPPPRRPPR